MIVDRIRLALPLVLLSVAACGSSRQAVTTSTSTTGAVPSTTTATAGATTAPSKTVPPTTAPSTTTLPPLRGLTVTPVVTGAAFPMVLVPWQEGLSLVGLRQGEVRSFDGAELSADPLLTIDVSTGGERGLLGLAVDPEESGLVFAHYSDPAGNTVVSAFDIASGGERVLLRVVQPASNHNGGWIQFGPDRQLYLGLGDGGGAGDRYGNGQNRSTLLGGIVRIDPGDGTADLWASGLRNPYRFWIDDADVYIGDVGQNTYEEVDVVDLASENPDFGWPITEGLHCFSPATGCDTAGSIAPVVEVSHADAGTCSIIGGPVYRGDRIPELRGTYFYSDYCGGWLRSFRWDGSAVVDGRDWTSDVGSLGNVVGFGTDPAGAVYVMTTDSILRLDPVR